MSIEAVVFDFGGVICFPPSHDNKNKLEKLTGLPLKTLQELNQKYRGEWDRGSYTGIEYYRFILGKSGVSLDEDGLACIVQRDMDGWKRINQATVKLIRDINFTRVKTGILSNLPEDFYEWAKKSIPIFGEVHTAIFSCKHKIIKPEAAIFNLLRTHIGCEFGEIVFFDDDADNISAANKLGIKGFIWEGPNVARQMIARMDSRLEALC
jgi:putative hydrolase of the HAD superfamily